MNDPTFWILSRASGIAAFLFLTASVLAGLVLTGKPFGRAVKGSTVLDVHRVLAVAGLSATGLHGVALVLDRAVEIPLAALVVPGLAPYRPLWTSLGVVAALLTGVLAASWAVRKRIGMTAWRRLHRASLAAFLLAAAHGVMAGTDTSEPWAMPMYATAVGLVGAALAWRIQAATSRARRPPAGARNLAG